MRNNKTAIKAVSLLWIGALLGGVFSFLTEVILARHLGAANLGIFAATMKTVSLLTPIAGFGVAQYWLKAFGEEGWGATRWFGISFRFTLLSILLVIFLIIFWGLFGPNDELTTLLLIIMSLYVPGQVSLELVSAKFQLEERYQSLTLWQLIPHFARLSLVFVFIYWLGEWTKLSHIASIYAFVASIITLVGIYQLRRMRQGVFELKGHIRHDDFPLNAQKQHKIPNTLDLVINIWPFGLAALFHLVYYQTDIVLVKYITGADAAGKYNVAFTVMAAVYLLPSAIYQKFLLPKVHRWANQDRGKFYRVYRQGNIAMLIMGSITMIGIWLTVSWGVPLLFGKQYIESVPLLNILAISAPLIFVALNAGATLVTQNHIKTKVKLMGIIAVFNIILNASMIPRFGATGAAISTVISNFFLLLLYYFAAEKIVFK